MSAVRPLFDPRSLTRIAEPPQGGVGWWAGAPSVLRDVDGSVLLAYRLRAPRPRRGYELRIARGDDGLRFTTIWSCAKEALGSASLERACLVRAGSAYRLYLSFVDPADGRWRIDFVEAADPARFDVRARQPALTAADIDGEAVKDPKIIRTSAAWLMLASFAPKPAAATIPSGLHASEDAPSTGLVRSCTGIATSVDGLAWRWLGPALEPRPGEWDAVESRISTVLFDEDRYLALYDGIADIADNYEERPGLATSEDLISWTRTSDGPVLRSPEGNGSLRYVDALDDGALFFYECARADGAHELRLTFGAKGQSLRYADRVNVLSASADRPLPR